MEGPAELPRAEARRLGKVGDGERLVQVLTRIGQGRLNAIRLGRQLKHGRKLRLPTAAAMIDNQLTRDRLCCFGAKVALNERKT